MTKLIGKGKRQKKLLQTNSNQITHLLKTKLRKGGHDGGWHEKVLKRVTEAIKKVELELCLDTVNAEQ